MPINLDEVADSVSKHVTLGKEEWYISQWKKSETNFTKDNILEELERLSVDRIKNPTTAVQPINEDLVDNIITTVGLNHTGDLQIGVVSTTLDWNSLGTGTGAEVLGDTDLGTELTGSPYVRKQFSVVGTRVRTNQTITFAMLWDDTDVPTSPGVPYAVAESGVHFAVSGSSNIYARAVFTVFNLDAGDILVIRATVLHQNGTL